MEVKLLHLYGDIMNLYGEYGSRKYWVVVDVVGWWGS